MNLKRSILLVLSLLLALHGKGQVKNALYNTFFSFGASPNIYISSYGHNPGVGADVSFGKWLLSTSGIRLQASVELSDRGGDIGLKPYYYGHLDILFDPVTSLRGRNRSDFFQSYLALGVGMVNNYSGDRDFCGFLGIGADWKISSDWRLFAELAAYIHPSDFDDNLHSSAIFMTRVGLLRDISYNPTRSRSRFETKCFKNDWFFEVGLGISSFNYSGVGSINDRLSLLTPNFEFGIGKRITHTWQIRFAIAGLHTHSHEELFSYYNLRADLMFDIMSFIMPDKPNFVFTVRPYISAGLVARLDDQSNFLFSPSFGAQFAYRHDNHNEIYLDSRYVVTPPRFAHVSIPQHIFSVGLFSIAVGYKYTFTQNSFK